jgi:hypothetical protein
MWHSYGGRRTARNPEQGDVRGKLREKRFDLAAEVPPYRPAPHEVAAEAFAALPQAEQDALQGWVVSSLTKTTPRAPYDGSPKTGLLRASTLAEQATQYLGHPVTASEVAGAALALGFKAVTTGWGPADLKLAAEWKDS